MRPGILSLLIISLCPLLLSGVEAAPGPFGPHSVSIISGNGQQQQSIRITYSGIFPLKVLSAIEDGLRVEMVTEIVIRRKSGFFLIPDAVFASFEISRGIRYDLIGSRYSITDEKTGSIQYFTSRNRVLNALGAEVMQPVETARQLVAGGKYYADARVVMRVGKLYPPFSFLPIISHKSPWVRSEVYMP